jgi:hypothetical protein
LFAGRRKFAAVDGSRMYLAEKKMKEKKFVEITTIVAGDEDA